MLPLDPDESVARLRDRLRDRTQAEAAVIINDSLGREWRNGTVGVAGLPALLDLRGKPDLFGQPLRVSEQAIADELSATALLLQGQAEEDRPVVLI